MAGWTQLEPVMVDWILVGRMMEDWILLGRMLENNNTAASRPVVTDFFEFSSLGRDLEQRVGRGLEIFHAAS